ncbi:MAG: hypothetical protein GX303_00695 [Clostridiales bacterium]|nr:hypothetical protein [Clostridiales bacterium]
MKNRILKYTSILVMSVMVFMTVNLFSVVASPAIWDGTVATGFESGDGTEANPFVIKNGAQLAYFASLVNDGDKLEEQYFALGDDIKLNDTSNVANWKTTAPANIWPRIGSSNRGFSGVFDGRGYTISGVYHKTDASYVGFFGNVSNAVIRNLNIKESFIEGKKYVGILIGIATNTQISNCTVDGYLYAGDEANIISDAGGIAGRARDCRIEYCINYSDILYIVNQDMLAELLV